MNKSPRLKPAPIKKGKGVVPELHLAHWMEGEVRYIADQSFHLALYVAASAGLSSYPSAPPTSSPPPRFKTPSKWNHIFHQTAGYACHHQHLYARFLEPLPKIRELGSALLSRYNGSLISQPIPLDDANEYNNLLERFGLRANRSFVHLEEGFYPIDIECLGRATKEKFSDDLRKELIKPLPRYPKRTIHDMLADWVDFGLVILGPNCD